MVKFYVTKPNENLFDRMFNCSFNSVNYNLRTDIIEEDDKYSIIVEMAGYHKDDIKLSLENDYLTIEAEKAALESKEEKETKYLLRERHLGKVSRSYYLKDVKEEEIKANFNNGLLFITVPKLSEAETKRLITIE